MSIHLEYVASGLAYTRFLSIAKPEDQVYLKKILSTLNKVQENASFSCLFNAYTEERLGKGLQAYKDDLKNIHSDSGGLQMMTKNMSIDGDRKQKIYDLQAAYSNVAMCFDEIPVVSSGTISLSDISSRFFDHKLIEEKARATGRNLKDQIHRFHDLGTECKPMLILQGNCFASYQQWTDYVCSELGDDMKYIYGISSAGSALGVGERESFIRAFFLSHGQYPAELNSKVIHLLGIGSPTKFLAYAELADHFKNCHISYDSTSHTSSISNGNFMLRNKTVKVNKSANSSTEKLVADVNEFLEQNGLDTISVAQFMQSYRGGNMFNENSADSAAQSLDFIHPFMSVLAYSIAECMYGVRDVMNKGPIYKQLVEKNAGYGVYKAFGTCRDEVDFEDFLSTYNKYMKSNKITSSKELPSVLDDFFC